MQRPWHSCRWRTAIYILSRVRPWSPEWSCWDVLHFPCSYHSMASALKKASSAFLGLNHSYIIPLGWRSFQLKYWKNNKMVWWRGGRKESKKQMLVLVQRQIAKSDVSLLMTNTFTQSWHGGIPITWFSAKWRCKFGLKPFFQSRTMNSKLTIRFITLMRNLKPPQ